MSIVTSVAPKALVQALTHAFTNHDLPQAAGDIKRWSGLHSGAEPFALLQLALQSQRFCLVLARDSQHAAMLERALKFYARFAAQTLAVQVFPDWETLPYDSFSPHEDIISQRLEVLHGLHQHERGVLIVPAATLLLRLPPQEFVRSNVLLLETGQTFDSESWRQQLTAAGYRQVDTVFQHGEYAVRGAIFDLFPMGCEVPVRIELFDDEIESLRTFDPDSQRSLEKCEQVRVLPAFEFPWDNTSRRIFRANWLDRFPKAADAPLLRDLKEGIKPHGIEYYGPLFFDQMATLFDYVPKDTLVVLPQALPEILEQLTRDIQHRYEERCHDIQRPILPPAELFLRSEECFALLKRWPRIALSGTAQEDETNWQSHYGALPDLSIDSKAEHPLAPLLAQCRAFSGPSLVVAESAGRREVLQDLLKRHNVSVQLCTELSALESLAPGELGLTVGEVDKGLMAHRLPLQIICESDLFGHRVMQRRRRKHDSDQAANAIKNLTELLPGAPVVHLQHGVGRYRGLQTITHNGQTDEFLVLEYAEEAKLYVPVSSLHLISRYSGTDESLAPLHRLGTDKWSVAKQKALEKIRDTAAELLEIYAKREARVGLSHACPEDAYAAFCEGFPFEETPDQLAAIDAVLGDMKNKRPMDRLVCGDVGFGKTEVAMRAAFIASYAGHQVAFLVPTTLLAQQHYDTLCDRFADTPIRIEVLSRFKTGKDQQKLINDVAEGKVDIVVGTHKLLQQDMKFQRLGLLIIDEEHRFGVQQKEKLKQYRANVDILTLTATPIPRTLNMAMGGLRDLSIIATPPARRLAVKTFVRKREDALIKEAILRETLRGGQVYYLFNEVKEIENEADRLRKLLPEARIGIAHGQMRERELEQAMSDFYHQRFNILVCSTIIETGIDIPNANTIIIDRADKFGLAQLHQLRGRVGRSHHQAYAYLMIPEEKKISQDAEKRLEAISAAQDLGAGFMLATHDLEIRGAGELLGEDQSGQIQSIGFSLYMELLDRAVKSLRAGQALSLDTDDGGGPEINLRLSAIIPEDYLPDVHARLILYKRIANADSEDALKEIQVEMIDRFGILPEPVKNLFRQTELKLRLAQLGIAKLDAGEQGGTIEFTKQTRVDPLKIVTLVQKKPQQYRLEGATRLRFTQALGDALTRFQAVEALLDQLAN